MAQKKTTTLASITSEALNEKNGASCKNEMCRGRMSKSHMTGKNIVKCPKCSMKYSIVSPGRRMHW